MTHTHTRRDILKATAAGLLVPSSVFGDVLKFVPIQKPEKVENEKPQIQKSVRTLFDVSDFRLHVFSAGYCEPCRRWKAQEQAQIDCQVIRFDVQALSSKAKRGISSVPWFRLQFRWPIGGSKFVAVPKGKTSRNGVRKESKQIEWSGYTPAAQINEEIRRQIAGRNRKIKAPGDTLPVKPQKNKDTTQTLGYRSAADLRRWVHVHYTQNTATRHADVSPRSAVWRHLCGSRHQFKGWQVNGLSSWEALALHSGRHAGTITPWG